MSNPTITQSESTGNRQTLTDFLAQQLPEKTLLIDGLLYKRDFITLLGRRRHGKTTLISNLALALTLPEPSFLGYQIPQAQRVTTLYLEDDARELQDKLRLMARGKDTEGRFCPYTKDYFLSRGITIDIQEERFRKLVSTICRDTLPDLLILDNLAHLIGAEYNKAEKIHELVRFVYELQSTHNVAVLIAAHPRKRSKGEVISVSLRHSPEDFFEECMGSSHLINSTGSLWGIERDVETEKTYLVLGAQRYLGRQGLTSVEKDEHDWFHCVSDYLENLALACNTPKREQAWALLPEMQPFKFKEACTLVAQVMAKGTFYVFWKELLRLELLVKTGEATYAKPHLEASRGNSHAGKQQGTAWEEYQPAASAACDVGH